MDLINDVMTALRGQGLDAEIKRRDVPLQATTQHADALVRIGIDGHEIDYLVEAKRQLTPALLGGTVAQLAQMRNHDKRPQLLITTYVTPPLAERLREMGTQFADAAGNAFLRPTGALIWVTGRKPQKPLRTDRTPRAFQPTGIKLIFGLICMPELAAAPYREIADKTGTALGTINWVMRDLQEMQYLTAIKRTRRLNATKRMLDEWALAYARTLRPKLLIGRYRTTNALGWQNWQIENHEALWGGEPAGALLTGYLKPGTLTLYAKQVPARMIFDQKLMTAPNRLAEDGIVEFRQRFWNFDVPTDKPHIVPPALVYADLLATGDARCMETARKIYDGYLARLFAE
jgi:hypothetical protein